MTASEILDQLKVLGNEGTKNILKKTWGKRAVLWSENWRSKTDPKKDQEGSCFSIGAI